ncbi:hypothetical protein [Candidatus Methylacidiphilum infernorum]|uniref:hypothetical protein n=1 Tax=Candidatus Methylacidiphilum infernorum TaxID=511746 RepID=UPI0011D0E365|nr:hypothetical protein [Candidatus Methylacidiphilum infernorum]
MEMKSQDRMELEGLKKRIKEHLEQQVEKHASAHYFEQMHKSLHRRLRVEMIKNTTFSEMLFEKLQWFFDAERKVLFRSAFAGIFIFVAFLAAMSIGLSKRTQNISPSSLAATNSISPQGEGNKQPLQVISSSVPSKQPLEIESTRLSPSLPHSQDSQSVVQDSLTHYEAMVAF